MTGPENPVSKSVVIRSEQAPLATVAETPFLQKVGFTPALAQRLKELNDVLILRAPAVRSVSIEMIPGETPLINTHVEHESGYRVFLNSDGEKASLTVRSTADFGPLSLLLPDIQTFVADAFPEDTGRIAFVDGTLFGTRGRHIKVADREIDLTGLDVQEALNIVHQQENEPATLTYLGAKVMIGDQELMVLALQDRAFRYARGPHDRDLQLFLKEFKFTGKPEAVEAMLAKVLPFFDKHKLYPVAYGDVPDMRPQEEQDEERRLNDEFEGIVERRQSNS